jgi:hypothetical protein
MSSTLCNGASCYQLPPALVPGPNYHFEGGRCPDLREPKKPRRGRSARQSAHSAKNPATLSDDGRVAWAPKRRGTLTLPQIFDVGAYCNDRVNRRRTNETDPTDNPVCCNQIPKASLSNINRVVCHEETLIFDGPCGGFGVPKLALSARHGAIIFVKAWALQPVNGSRS